jgi:hypothetical protein
MTPASSARHGWRRGRPATDHLRPETGRPHLLLLCAPWLILVSPGMMSLTLGPPPPPLTPPPCRERGPEPEPDSDSDPDAAAGVLALWLPSPRRGRTREPKARSARRARGAAAGRRPGLGERVCANNLTTISMNLALRSPRWVGLMGRWRSSQALRPCMLL